MSVVDYRLGWDDGAHVIHWRRHPAERWPKIDTSVLGLTYKLEQIVRWDIDPPPTNGLYFEEFQVYWGDGIS